MDQLAKFASYEVQNSCLGSEFVILVMNVDCWREVKNQVLFHGEAAFRFVSHSAGSIWKTFTAWH